MRSEQETNLYKNSDEKSQLENKSDQELIYIIYSVKQDYEQELVVAARIILESRRASGVGMQKRKLVWGERRKPDHIDGFEDAVGFNSSFFGELFYELVSFILRK